MIKTVLTLIFLCLFLMSGSYSNLYAAKNTVLVKMQKHIDKVKLTKPGKYRTMLENAGGSITNCISCHQDFGINKNTAGKFSPKFR